jgi:hypothetical protein
VLVACCGGLKKSSSIGEPQSGKDSVKQAYRFI